MTTLGAVLAGGRAVRFGSDKALADRGDGLSLLDTALALIAPQVDAICVVGRRVDGVASVEDWPASGMGPLGGLAGALRHARAQGFDRLATVPVDTPDLPRDLVARLSPAPACLGDLPVAGLWRSGDVDVLEAMLSRAGRHAMRDFARACGAREATLGAPLANINTPADLTAWRRAR